MDVAKVEQRTKIWEVEFERNGELEVHTFWENSQSSVELFIKTMTKNGGTKYVGKKLIKEI